MKKIVILVLMLLTLSSAFAATNYNCSGMGQNVRGDAYGNIWINGQPHHVSGKTVDGQGVVTENFINTNGTLVYVSLYPISNTSLRILVFNAVTNGLISTFLTSCTFSSRAAGKSEGLFDQKHFSSVRG